MKLSVLLLCASIVIKGTHSANILIVGTLLSHSHHFWNEAIALGLVDKGHNVTMLSPDPTKVKRDNFSVITLDGQYDLMKDIDSVDSMNKFVITATNIPTFTSFFEDILIAMCKQDINHPKLKLLLNYPKDFKFDLILWDNTAGECLYPIIEHFGNPPIMGLSPYGLSNYIEEMYGAHVYPYVAQVVMPFVKSNTIWERMINVFFINYANYKRATSYKPKSVEISRTLFRDWDEQKFEEIEKRFSICLINWNIALSVPQPLSPNLIPVGGVQIKENEVLPKNLQSIFDKPSKGVVFFSLGSNIESESISVEILQPFCDCFAELSDYQIIWKITAPKELKVPGNTFATKWAPQTAILAQNKTKLFISHGGGLSSHETTHFGVPVLVLPVFLDQINNAYKFTELGGGEMLTMEEITNPNRKKDLFCNKVKKILFSESYTQKIKELSAIYRGGERTPLQTAVHWVEYVLRHGDAKHLSPLSRNMSMFFTQNLDIYATVIGFIILQLWIVYGIIKFVMKMFTGKGSKKIKTN